MKIIRSTKCSLKFATNKKKKQLQNIINEYSIVVNYFIKYFWNNGTIAKVKLLKPIVDLPKTWLSARLRKVAAREALDMVNSVKNKTKHNTTMPCHNSNCMKVSSTIVELKQSKQSKHYDAWLHLSSVGSKKILDLPIKLHKHYNKWNTLGKRLNSYIITKDYVQFCFEIETGTKQNIGNDIGIDTGINKLASLSNNKTYGNNLKETITKIKRKQHGSNKQQKAIKQLRHEIDTIVKQIIKNENPRLIVVEQLKNISKGTKKRVSKQTRKLISNWNYAYWLKRLQQNCEENRVYFRSVSPWNTSIICSQCGNADKKQRLKEEFICSSCGHTDDADTNAAKNILNRCLNGVYRPAFNKT